MSEEVKQEGEFKIKTPSKPKNLGDNIGEPIKVNMKEPLIDIKPDVKKVVIKKEPIVPHVLKIVVSYKIIIKIIIIIMIMIIIKMMLMVCLTRTKRV